MDGCNCQTLTTDELKSLVGSDDPQRREQAAEWLVSLLTSENVQARCRGYEFLNEGLTEALYCSCLNYRGLVGGFTQPLLDAVTRSVEFWAASSSKLQRDESGQPVEKWQR